MKRGPVVVCGTVRNCGATIAQEIKQLAKALVDFEEVHYLIIESDSQDNSLEELEQLKQQYKHFDYKALGELSTTIPLRTARIAHCRNQYLEAIEQEERYKKAAYVLVSDLDGMNSLLTKEAIASCWELEEWDLCTANQEGLYYDLWAFRHPLLCPNDCWKVYRYLVDDLGVNALEAKNKAIYSQMFTLPTTAAPIEVASSFGGLGLYKRAALVGKRYVGLNEQGQEFCEHVALHEQMRQAGARLWINPQLINGPTPAEHVNLGNRRQVMRHIVQLLFPNMLESNWYKSLKKKVTKG
ncbi:MAG: hypothetical protein ACRBFS_10810 [Aureispira sp.]